MAGVPAYCERCNTLFESPLVSIGDGAVVSFSNSGTTCLRCGNMARILDGTYTSVGAALQVIRGSTFSREQVARLQALRNSLAQHKEEPKRVIPEEVVQAIAAIQPELGAAINLLQNNRAGWAAFMLFLFIVLRQCSSEGASINIDLSTHVTQVVPTRIEQTALHYPQKHKRQDGSDHPDSDGGRTEAKKK